MELVSLPSQVTTTALGVYFKNSGPPREVLQTEVRGGGRQEDAKLPARQRTWVAPIKEFVLKPFSGTIQQVHVIQFWPVRQETKFAEEVLGKVFLGW